MSALVLSGFFLASNAAGSEQTYTIWSDWSSQTPSQNKWFGNYYVTGGQSDGTLKVGGWGDQYTSMIKIPLNFPVPGRTIINGADLHLYSYGSSRPTTMEKFFWLNPWSETSTSDHWNLTYYDLGSVPAPVANGWYSMDISTEFFAWYLYGYQNYGIGLFPNNNDNKFNYFYSPKGPGGGLSLRPFITVRYEAIPNFKMPLEGNGKAWKLTTQPGGREYDKQFETDPAHQGRQYYSIDFSHFYSLNGGPAVDTTGTDVPILAAAGGVVYEVGDTYRNPTLDPNGYYVRIDHDYDGNPNTGFQTVYCHMKPPGPIVHKGDIVTQGKILGYMGTTGDSTGVHLHITFYFQNNAGTLPLGSDSAQLNFAAMDGYLLTSYTVGETWNGIVWYPVYYYLSSNIPH